jgi:hypothetical protein
MIYAALKSVKSGGAACIGWVWQFTLQSAQRHTQISKIGNIFEKVSKLVKSVFEHNFFAKSCECRRWLTLGRGRNKYSCRPHNRKRGKI